MKPAPQALLLDMDGVFYTGDRAIDGAFETLDRLKAGGMPFRFITNTTTRPPAALLDKLAGFGFEVEADQVFTAVSATLNYLEGQGSPALYLLVRDSLRPLFEKFPENDHDPDYVVIGDIGAHWDYETLNHVFNMLMRGSRLLCMHRNKFFQEPEGLRMDIGAFVAALEHVAGVEALVVGKPSPAFFDQAVRSLDAVPGEVAIVGDDIDSDIGGGQACGLRGILVQTGKYREEYCQRSSVRPDHVIPSIADLPELLDALQPG